LLVMEFSMFMNPAPWVTDSVVRFLDVHNHVTQILCSIYRYHCAGPGIPLSLACYLQQNIVY
jgi:hypothetical protein